MIKQTNTILAIDDELGPRASLEMIFKNTHRVISAREGEEGLDLLQKHPVDVVILDIRMPNLSGIEVLRRIKEIDPILPVILLTGYGSLDSAQEAVRLGAFDYLNKPYDINKLKDVVDKALEKKRLEVRAKKNVKELSELNERLKRNLEESNILAELGKISSSYIHELKNPLTNIVGYVDLLIQQLLRERERGNRVGEDFEHFLSIIEREIKRCCRLSTNFLSFSNHDQTWKDTIDINQLIGEMLEVIGPAIKVKDIKTELRLDESIPSLLCCPDLIKQALLNLILNSIEALSRDGVITVTTRLREAGKENRDKMVEVTVEDDGPGIPREIIEKLFENSLATKKRGSGNAGLGLDITRKIIDHHHGSIGINGRPGGGTSVRILLPLAYDTKKN